MLTSKTIRLLLIIFLSFFFVCCKNCFAAGETEEAIKKELSDALGGMKNNDVEKLFRDFSPDVKAANAETVFDYNSLKEYFSNLFSRFLLTDIDEIRFLDNKVNNNTAAALVQFRVSFIDLLTKETKTEMHNNFFFLEKVNDSWKVMSFVFMPPIELKKPEQPQASPSKETQPKKEVQNTAGTSQSLPQTQARPQPKPKVGNATTSITTPFSK